MPSRLPSRTTKYAPWWVFDTQLCRGPSMVVVPDPRVPVSCGCLRIPIICLDFSFTTVWIPVGTVRQISTTHSGGTWRSRLDRTVILAWTSLTHVNPKPTASAIVPQEGAEIARNLGLWGMPSAFHQGFEGHVSLGALPRPACNQKRGDKSITPIRQT